MSKTVDREEQLRDRLEEHREYLQKLADMDVPASEDARLALAILDGAEGGQS